jgi:hypothetical protein
MFAQWSYRAASRMRLRWQRENPRYRTALAVGAGSLIATHAWINDDRVVDLELSSDESQQPSTAYKSSYITRIWLDLSSYLNSTAAAQCEGSSFSSSVLTRLSNIRKRRNTFKTMQDQAERETLESRYAVDWSNPVGEGSFGSVYAAEDRKTSERVAIKKISKRATDDVSFQREMDALMHIREHGGHPHICGLRANYDQGDYYYLVLDLVSGGEMFDHLCTHGAYSEADAARLIREVASALAFLHGLVRSMQISGAKI